MCLSELKCIESASRSAADSEAIRSTLQVSSVDALAVDLLPDLEVISDRRSIDTVSAVRTDQRGAARPGRPGDCREFTPALDRRIKLISSCDSSSRLILTAL